MKKLKNLLLVVLAVTSALSGSAQRKASLPPEAVAMEDSITKIYHKIAGDYNYQEISGIDQGLTNFQRGIFNLEELPTDEAKWLWDPAEYGGINYGNVSADLAVIRGPWLGLNYIVNLCNNFINNDFHLDLITNESARSEAMRQREEYVRQAKILRSAMYYYLLNEYGNVPYSDETTATDITPLQLSTDMTTGRRKVTKKVISTLEEIVDWYKANDPENKPVYGHVGYDVAEALLVKFYLNFEIFTGTPAWDQTLTHAKSIIERRGKGGFGDSGLSMNYSQNFSYNNRTAAENEIIWRIATKDPDGTEIRNWSNGGFMMLSQLGEESGDDIQWKQADYNSNNGWKCVVGLRNLTDAFEWNYQAKESPDQRVAWWGTAKHGFIVNNPTLKGWEIWDDLRNESQYCWGRNGFIPVKFTNWNIKDDGSVDTADIPYIQEPYCIDYGVIRLAEIYLSAAEAILHGAGESSEALRYVNFVRERAGMPAFTTLNMETLQAERQRELYTECNRRTDLIRYGKWISGYNWDWKGGARTGRDYDPNFIVYPIPESVVEKYGYVQNPLPSQQELDPVGNPPAEWKIIGSFCDFDPDKGISLQPQGDGSYTLMLSELEGSFSFIAGDKWAATRLGNGSLDDQLYGNINIDLSDSGKAIETESRLSNVRLTLYPYARVLIVDGLKENQICSGIDGNSSSIYLRGDVNNWTAEEKYKMTYEGNGLFSLKVEELYGNFKFAERSWSKVNYGPQLMSEIIGNCTAGVRNHANSNFEAPIVLKNVEILLNTKMNTVSFSGLPNTQETPPYDPNMQKYGHFLLDKQITYLTSASNYEGDEVILEARNMPAGEGCYISKAKPISTLPIYERRNAMVKYLYTDKEGNGLLSEDTRKILDFPAADLSSGWFEFEKDGSYRLHLNSGTNLLTVERFDPEIYIVGDMWSENEVYNGFLEPSPKNKDIYDREFTLSKDGDVYKGRFRLGSSKEGNTDADRLPQFRFYTKLDGWVSAEYSLGSALPDFYCLTVSLENARDYPVIEQGRGNWGFDAPGQWINITLDLKNMRVSFRLDGDDSGINETETDATEGEPIWYNMQGIRVEKPTKGVYIKMNGAKKSKVLL